MNNEKWSEICFLLHDNIKVDISENDFEQCVIQALRVLNWKEYLGDIDIRPSFQIGASNRIIPDFVIKSQDNQKLFVIEIKQPNIPLNTTFQQQLFSYMRQLKLEYGILIGQGIQIFYDGNLSSQDDPILLETIKFEKDNKSGGVFIELFDKLNYNKNSLENFTKNALKKIDKKKDFKILTNKILSNDFIDKLNPLIKQGFIGEYDGELIDSVLKNIKIEISSNINKIEHQSKSIYSKTHSSSRKMGVIESIYNAITHIPKSQEEILEILVKLFPNRPRESMRNTVRAQLGGKSQPVRLEREKNISLNIFHGADNISLYSTNHASKSVGDTHNEMKVGEFIQKSIAKAFEQNLISPSELNNLQKRDYSKNVFNQNFEVLRNMNREIVDSTGRKRYYSKKIFCGNYRLTSQWFEYQREPFKKWLKSLNHK
jgi:hypothetical protein